MTYGHNFWLESPTKVRLTQLSYILKAVFRDTPLAYSFSGGQVARWPGGQVARWQVAGGTKETIGKWGIPKKSFQNVAQLNWPYLFFCSSGGQVARWQVARWPGDRWQVGQKKTIGKWGITEKSLQKELQKKHCPKLQFQKIKFMKRPNGHVGHGYGGHSG